MQDKGFGIVTSNLHWKPDSNQLLISMIREKDPELYKEYEEFMEDSRGEFDFEEDATADFLENWEEDNGMFSGYLGLLAFLINQEEYDGDDRFYYRDCCLYVSAMVPVNDDDRKTIPTQQEINKHLAAYLNPLLKEPVRAAEWLDIYY